MKKQFVQSLVALLVFPFLSGCSQQPWSKNELTLKDALKDKFLIGTALNASQITGRDTAGIRVVKEHFNALVAENCMKSREIHPEKDRYNFVQADALVDFGVQNNMTITGHTLIWHSQAPNWFCHDEKGELVSPEVLRQNMKEHISTVVGRYKGRIAGWDVVNEAINDNGSWRESPFYKILGEEFIYLAFEYAHEADPEAELYYNDYNEWHTGRRDAIVNMIHEIKRRGLRIDAIGMQGHIGMKEPTLNAYQQAIDAYAAAGVKVMVTELDLSALPYTRRNVGANISDTDAYQKEVNPYTESLPDSVSQVWNEHMMKFFDLFLKNSDKITRVTLWGVADGDSWKNNFPMRGRTDYPLLFDRKHQPKPVVRMIIEAATKK